MSPDRRLLATFRAVRPRPGFGVELCFEPARALPDAERIEDFASLVPDDTIPAVLGLGKVLRILRVARIAAPADPRTLLGREDAAADLLERALGTRLVLRVRPRNRISFAAWTEGGVHTIEDVAEVIESRDAFFIVRRSGWPVHIARETVVRRHTRSERWYQVMEIERRGAHSA
jgi:hypothetical protein